MAPEDSHRPRRIKAPGRRILRRVARLPVRKTYKLFIGGAFPRSESGRTYEAQGQNVSRASRKDVRDAVVAARAAQPKWGGATAYNRGQVLYRIAEMMEARTAEFAELASGRDEVERAIDRWVWYAGFADKLAQVLGSSNPVAGPYFNFTVPEPTGVVGIVAPAEPPLLGLVSRLAPALVGGNAVVAIASEASPLAAIELAEVLATSDVPGRRRQPAHRLPRRARAVARLAHGRERDRRHRRRRPPRRPRARRRREREARRLGRAGRAEPRRDRRVPRAEDRLAPDRRLSRLRFARRCPGHDV